MKYRLTISHDVYESIAAHVAYLQSEGASEQSIDRWLSNLFDAFESLDTFPERRQVAESVSIAKGYEVRRMNRGDYVIYYRIHAQAQAVYIISLRHGRCRPWEDEE